MLNRMQKLPYILTFILCFFTGGIAGLLYTLLTGTVSGHDLHSGLGTIFLNTLIGILIGFLTAIFMAVKLKRDKIKSVNRLLFIVFILLSVTFVMIVKFPN